MKRTSFLMTVVVFCLSLIALGDDPKVPGHSEDVAQLSRDLDKEYKNKSNRNTERIVEIYQIFDDIYPKATPKEKKAITRAIKKGFDVKPFPDDNAFMLAGAACLSDMGKEGLDALIYGLNRKTLVVRKSMNEMASIQKYKVKEVIIQSIGFNKNPAALKTLYKLLKDKDSRIIVAACKALGCYKSLPIKERKAVVEQILKVYCQLDAAAEKNGDESPDYERLIAVEVHFNDALQRLTLRTFDTAGEYKQWYAENKDKKKW